MTVISANRASLASILLTLLLLCVWAAGTAQAHTGSQFITLGQYLGDNPAQVALMDSFAAQVEAQARPLNPQQLKPLKIAAVYPGAQQSDYWHRNMRALRLRLEQLGFQHQFIDHPHIANASIDQQQQAISAALAQDPDYLILTLDGIGKKKLIEPLLARDRPKIILLNITTPLMDWRSHQPFLYSGFDHRLGTRLLAEVLFKSTDGPSRSIGLLYWRPGYVSQMRGGTFVDFINARGEQLSASYYTQSDMSSAHRAALQLLTDNPEINIIFACTTDVALGTIAAINEKGLKGQVIVNGWGGGDAELQAIRDGNMALTVMRMNDDTAIAIAEAIANDQTGRPVPQVYSGRLVVVTPAHSAEQIDALSATAFRYSNP